MKKAQIVGRIKSTEAIFSLCVIKKLKLGGQNIKDKLVASWNLYGKADLGVRFARSLLKFKANVRMGRKFSKKKKELVA